MSWNAEHVDRIDAQLPRHDFAAAVDRLFGGDQPGNPDT